jgi:hypothetical protein
MTSVAPSRPPDSTPAGTATPHYGERAIQEAELICFDNPRQGRAYEVAIELPEFTCKCPFSGYPDFAVMRLLYQPGPRVLELKALKLILKEGGTIHFFVPCDSISYAYNPEDINYHLYSWSPQNLGNLFHEAGFEVVHSRPYTHKWPPYYRHFAKLGWPIFNLLCKIYAHFARSWWQVEVLARKK